MSERIEEERLLQSLEGFEKLIATADATTFVSATRKIRYCDILKETRRKIESLYARIEALEEARTPRLLTLDEVKAIQTCWIEYDEMIFPAIYYCQGNDKRFSIFIVNAEDDLFEDYCEDLTDNEIWLENVFMNQLWRCWTQRPTDEQRKAVPWE